MESDLDSVYSPAGTCDAWLHQGLFHKVDGPAVVWASGTQEWWFKGKRHRADGPAVEYESGTQEWWFKGKRHRTDGPAVVRSSGTREWWFNDKQYDQFTYWLMVNKSGDTLNNI